MADSGDSRPRDDARPALRPQGFRLGPQSGQRGGGDRPRDGGFGDRDGGNRSSSSNDRYRDSSSRNAPPNRGGYDNRSSGPAGNWGNKREDSNAPSAPAPREMPADVAGDEKVEDDGERHSLENNWVWWFDRRSNKGFAGEEQYKNALKQLGEFDTVPKCLLQTICCSRSI